MWGLYCRLGGNLRVNKKLRARRRFGQTNAVAQRGCVYAGLLSLGRRRVGRHARRFRGRGPDEAGGVRRAADSHVLLRLLPGILDLGLIFTVSRWRLMRDVTFKKTKTKGRQKKARALFGTALAVMLVGISFCGVMATARLE